MYDRPSFLSPSKTASLTPGLNGVYYAYVVDVLPPPSVKATHTVDARIVHPAGGTTVDGHAVNALLGSQYQRDKQAALNEPFGGEQWGSRVFVRIPRLSGDFVQGPLNYFGGTPAIGDTVIVAFVEGRQDELVVIAQTTEFNLEDNYPVIDNRYLLLDTSNGPLTGNLGIEIEDAGTNPTIFFGTESGGASLDAWSMESRINTGETDLRFRYRDEADVFYTPLSLSASTAALGVDTTVAGTFDVTGDSTVTGTFDVIGNTSVTGTTTLNGNTTIVGQTQIDHTGSGHLLLRDTDTASTLNVDTWVGFYGSDDVRVGWVGTSTGNNYMNVYSDLETEYIVLNADRGVAITRRDGATIGGSTWDNGVLRIGTSSAGIAFDDNEIFATDDLYIQTAAGSANYIYFRNGSESIMQVRQSGVYFNDVANNPVIFDGTSDNLIITQSGDDFSIYNDQRNNGIVIYDGDGGIELHYAGQARLEIDSSNNIKARDPSDSTSREIFPYGTMLTAGQKQGTGLSISTGLVDVLSQTITLNYSGQPVIAFAWAKMRSDDDDLSVIQLEMQIGGTSNYDSIIRLPDSSVANHTHTFADGDTTSGNGSHAHSLIDFGGSTTSAGYHTHYTYVSGTTSSAGGGGSLSNGTTTITNSWVRSFTPSGSTFTIKLRGLIQGGPTTVDYATMHWVVWRG